MLEPFDWVRLARGGAELMTTLRFIQNEALDTKDHPVAGPHSALSGPCIRCGVYSRRPRKTYCSTCSFILSKTPNYIQASKDSLLLWGQTGGGIPRPLRHPHQKIAKFIYGPAFFKDNAFLLGIKSFKLITFLREIVFAHGYDLSGHFLIFPTVGTNPKMTMNDVLITAMRQRLPIIPDQLTITFMPNMYWSVNSRKMWKGYDNSAPIQEFIALLDTAQTFKHIFGPQDQDHILNILNSSSFQEKMFHWHRFVGLQDTSVQEFLSTINMVNWLSEQRTYFFEILPYVSYNTTN